MLGVGRRERSPTAVATFSKRTGSSQNCGSWPPRGRGRRAPRRSRRRGRGPPSVPVRLRSASAETSNPASFAWLATASSNGRLEALEVEDDVGPAELAPSFGSARGRAARRPAWSASGRRRGRHRPAARPTGAGRTRPTPRAPCRRRHRRRVAAPAAREDEEGAAARVTRARFMTTILIRDENRCQSPPATVPSGAGEGLRQEDRDHEDDDGQAHEALGRRQAGHASARIHPRSRTTTPMSSQPGEGRRMPATTSTSTRRKGSARGGRPPAQRGQAGPLEDSRRVDTVDQPTGPRQTGSERPAAPV